MLRRPPGHVAQQRKYLLAFAAILLPWLPVVDAQQQQSKHEAPEQHYVLGSRDLGDHAAANGYDPLLGPAVTVPEVLEAPSTRRKNTVSRSDTDSTGKRTTPHSSSERYLPALLPEDASAPHIYALDSSVRAPSPPRHRSPATRAGLSSPQTARSLRDWEMEDTVLLATVDGNLHATDRKTGKTWWQTDPSLVVQTVETIHYRTNKSDVDEDYSVIDDYRWVVEPCQDGALYLWVPHSESGLVPMGTTMKHMVEVLAPYSDKEQDIVYTGDKKTVLYTLDAATGNVLKMFGSSGSNVTEMKRCLKPNALANTDEECSNSGTPSSNSGTITLGRTEYTVSIQRTDGQPIATLKYSEWGPNTYDADLLQQHQTSMHRPYVASQHDGQVYFLDPKKDNTYAVGRKFSGPVVRVFEMARARDPTTGSAIDDNPEFIVLPQPTLPSSFKAFSSSSLQSPDDQADRIFINKTETGSWYAMSSRSYPMIVKAPAAEANNLEWWKGQHAREAMDSAQLSKALIGAHLREKSNKETPLLTIDAGSQVAERDDGVDNASLQFSTPIRDHLQPSAIFNEAKKLPEMAAAKVLDLISNPILIVLFVCSLIYYQQDLKRWFKRKRSKNIYELLKSPFEASSAETTPEPSSVAFPEATEKLAHASTPSTSSEAGVPATSVPDDATLAKATETEGPSSVTFADPLEIRERSESISGDQGDDLSNGQAAKKKAHRGRRGGTKHKKGNKNKVENSPQSNDDDAVAASVDEVVKKAKTLGEEPKLEPDILTVTNDVEEVSGPVLKMGSLEVNTDQQLGTGSNGTVVFAGKWDGRDVAIKRMLIQFNEIASQETKLLRESDDHPNGMWIILASSVRSLLTTFSYPILCSTGTRRIPVHCTGALPGLSG